MPILIGAYCRVSTDEQASVIEGSLDNQRHRMQSFVDIKNLQDRDWGRIVEIFVDDGCSAKDTNRPAYQRMVGALKSGRIDAIMVTELSRLSRNIPDFCDFHKVLEAQGAKFLSIKEQFDTSTPSGKMMLYNMINLAQFEREQTSERVAINGHARAQRGLLNGGPAILGYDKDPLNKTTFIVNAREAESVRKIFELFAESRTLARTIRDLKSSGIKPKARHTNRNRLVSEGRWTVGSLRFVLQNKAYLGLREINKVHQTKAQEKLKPWQRYSTVKASWSAIVRQREFDLVQKILDENRAGERLRLSTSASRVFAASGVSVCGECGRKLVGQSAHGKTSVHKYYVHSSKSGDVIKCSIKRIKAGLIEEKIADHLCHILELDGHFKSVEKSIKQSLMTTPGAVKKERAVLTTELQTVIQAIRNTFKLQSALGANAMALSEVAVELENLSQQKHSLESRLEGLKSQEYRSSEIDDAVEDLQARLKAFKRGWPKASAITKKAMVKEVIQSIVVQLDGLTIQYRLKGNLNEEIAKHPPSSPGNHNKNVIDLNKKTSKKLPTTAATLETHNAGIMSSQVVRGGRG